MHQQASSSNDIWLQKKTNKKKPRQSQISMSLMLKALKYNPNEQLQMFYFSYKFLLDTIRLNSLKFYIDT